MLALHRSDEAALNDTARALLVAERVVDSRPIHVLDRPYAPGDRIITLHNDPRYGLINGQRGTISRTVSDRDGFTVHFDGDTRDRVIPGAYLEAGHIDHAYAMTAHKAQGLTCDRAYVLGTDDLYAEAGYTALSRGRYENRLYVAVDDEPEVDHHGSLELDDPIDGIRAALHPSERQGLAIAQLDGRTAARISLPPTLDRHGPDTPRQDVPGLDDGIDLSW